MKAHPSNSPKAKAAADERARLRRNQRNSRARKQEYVHDLERRWSECVRLGVQASVEIQREARRIHEENTVLRDVIREMGMTDDALRQRLNMAIGAHNLQQGSAQEQEFVPPTRSPNNAISTTSSLSSAIPPYDLEQQHTVLPLIDATTSDALQTWDLYSWVNDLANIKDAYSFNAQSQIDCSEESLLSSNLDQASANPGMLLPIESGDMNTAWLIHDNHFGSVNNMSFQLDDAQFPDTQGVWAPPNHGA